MMFVNWWPDPRNMHLPTGLDGVTLSTWSSGRGFNATSTDSDGIRWFQLRPASGLPAGERLNLTLAVDCEDFDTRSQNFCQLYDPTLGPSKAFAAIGNTAGRQTLPFTVPDSGRLGLQFVGAANTGSILSVYDIAIVSDEGLAWMRDNNQWWIHHALMPLTRS